MSQVQIETFIPLFYLVWSDDLLTPFEFTTLKNFIEDQEWLKEDERKLLLSKIDISNPPTRDNISNWKNKIEQITAKNPNIKSIYEIAVALSGGNV
jgi:acyl-CoA oxidase